MKRSFLLLGITLIFAGLAGLKADAVSYHGLVKVQACHPSLNENTFYGGPAYAPAYYPYAGRPYYWGSVYGYTYYQPPITTTDPQLAIDYINTTHQTMKEIEFGLIANGNLVAEVKDVGKFSPGVEIKHKFGLSHNVFPLQTSLTYCPPLKIVYADGTKWKNPNLPALKHKLGGP